MDKEEYNKFLIMLFTQMGIVLGYLRSDNMSLAIITIDKIRDEIMEKLTKLE